MKKLRRRDKDAALQTTSNFGLSSSVKFWLPACCSINIGGRHMIFDLNIPWGFSMNAVKFNLEKKKLGGIFNVFGQGAFF